MGSKVTISTPQGAVVWITGISAAGKTTLCQALWRQVKPRCPQLVILDGDVIRGLFGANLGYSESERRVQIKRIQSFAKMLANQGLCVLVAALYSHPELLRWNRDNFTNYYEIYLNASLSLVRERDPRGLYAKSASGAMKDVVGVDIPWHPPEQPDLVIDSSKPYDVDEMAVNISSKIPFLTHGPR